MGPGPVKKRRVETNHTMSAIKKMIKNASPSHKRGMEIDGNGSINGNEEESFIVKFFEEVLPLLEAADVLHMDRDPLAMAVLTWSVEHDDLQLMRLLLKHSSMNPDLLILKRLAARLASHEDGCQPVLFVPKPIPIEEILSPTSLQKAQEEERMQLQMQLQQQGGADRGSSGMNRQSTSFSVLMWVGIAVQIFYISLVFLQSWDKLSSQYDTSP